MFIELIINGSATRTVTLQGTNNAVCCVDFGEGGVTVDYTLQGEGNDVDLINAYSAGLYSLKIFGAVEDITSIVASNESIQDINFNGLTSLKILDLSSNPIGYQNSLGIDSLENINLDSISATSEDIDNYLDLFSGVISDAIINLAGSNNDRTTDSNNDVEDIIDDNNELYVNQNNSNSTILGVDTVGTINFTNIYIQATLFTCSSTNLINSFDLYSRGNGFAKPAICLNNGGSPGLVISSRDDDSNAVSASMWNRIQIPIVELQVGVEYFLLNCGSTNAINGQFSSPGNSIFYRLLTGTFNDFEHLSDYTGWFSTSFSDRENSFRVQI